MLWKLFQLVIFVGVMATNIEWQWTPNPYVAAGAAIGAAFLATIILGWLFSLPRRFKRRPALHEQGNGSRPLRGRKPVQID
jgi:membrane associated rhomboid family serine protease